MLIFLIKTTYNYIALLFNFIYDAASYKKGAVLVFSSFLSTSITYIEEMEDVSFFGISYTFIILAVSLIMADFWTGSFASRYEHIRDNGKVTPGWFKSEKIAFTIYKMVSLLLLLWLSEELYRSIYNSYLQSDSDVFKPVYKSASVFVSLCRTTVFTLICGREYVSIGENIERRFGKKFYAFKIFEKIFDIIELKFIRKLEDKC